MAGDRATAAVPAHLTAEQFNAGEKFPEIQVDQEE
jgi:hypothetical protein